MGDIGTPSRILCAKFGSPFTYATFHAERMLAPGQLTYQQMKETYHYEQITPETEIFGVIADPVAASESHRGKRSPVAHERRMQRRIRERRALRREDRGFGAARRSLCPEQIEDRRCGG